LQRKAAVCYDIDKGINVEEIDNKGGCFMEQNDNIDVKLSVQLI
jgi:hypothetical protein